MKTGPDYHRLKTMVAREMPSTGGGGLAMVPNMRVCKHPLVFRSGTRRERRMNQHLAVVPSSRRGNTSSESRRRESRAAPKGYVAATWYGDDSPHVSWKCAQVAGKAGENGQYSGAAHPRRLPSVVTHSRPMQASA